MSDGVNVTDVGDKLARANALLAGIPNGVRNATYNALTRAGDAAKTKAGQYAAAEYTITKSKFMSHVKTKLHFHYSMGSEMSAEVEFVGTVIPLIEFKTRYAKNGGITTSVKRGGGGTLSHAFFARSDGLHIFERVGTSRLPIEKKYGPSTAHMMQNDKVIRRMDETIRETFAKRMDHEIVRILNGWGGR